MTTGVTLHDLNLAAAFCDRLVVLTPAPIERAWNVRADVAGVATIRLP